KVVDLCHLVTQLRVTGRRKDTGIEPRHACRVHEEPREWPQRAGDGFGARKRVEDVIGRELVARTAHHVVAQVKCPRHGALVEAPGLCKASFEIVEVELGYAV